MTTPEEDRFAANDAFAHVGRAAEEFARRVARDAGKFAERMAEHADEFRRDLWRERRQAERDSRRSERGSCRHAAPDVRRVFEDIRAVIADVLDGVDDLIESVFVGRPKAPEEGASSEWVRVVNNRDATCAACGRPLRAGDEAYARRAGDRPELRCATCGEPQAAGNRQSTSSGETSPPPNEAPPAA
jgi:hypothetical protein